MVSEIKRPLSILVAGVGTISGVAAIAVMDGWIRWVAVSVVGILLLYVAFSYWKLYRRLDPLENADLAFSAPYKVSPATRRDVAWVAETAKRVYGGIDVIPHHTLLAWYDQNPHCFWVIRDRFGRLCGNIDVLPLKPEMLDLFIERKIIERDIKDEHVLPPLDRDKVSTRILQGDCELRDENTR